MLVLLALNVAAELVSFSRVIDAVPPLRWFDRLGCTATATSRARRAACSAAVSRRRG